jgi:uncharacterized protein YciI
MVDRRKSAVRDVREQRCGVTMPTYLTVRRVRGSAWNPAVPMRDQAFWLEHAAFMNALAAEGFVVLGGPVGSGEEILLVIDSTSEDTVRARLAADPWSKSGLLAIDRVEPWTILLDGRTV